MREFTQQELSEIVGISRAQIGQIERARDIPAGLKPYVDIALALGVSLEALVAPAAIAQRWQIIKAKLSKFEDTDQGADTQRV